MRSSRRALRRPRPGCRARRSVRRHPRWPPIASCGSPNLDCVWADPARALSACPRDGRVGRAAPIPYPPDWPVGGPEAIGATREALGRTASGLGVSAEPAPPWIGADLLAGTAGGLLELACTCDALEGELARGRGATATNEQLLTLSPRRSAAPSWRISPRVEARRGPDRRPARRRCAGRRRAARDLAPPGGEGAEPAPYRAGGTRVRSEQAAAGSIPRIAGEGDAPLERRPVEARPPALR